MDALAQLDGDQSDAAVVVHDGLPVGVVTRGALRGHAGFGHGRVHISAT